jgi:hypothetical protein
MEGVLVNTESNFRPWVTSKIITYRYLAVFVPLFF